MYQLFYAPTPNGWKVTILLEELVAAGALSAGDYEIVPVNLSRGEQFSEEFLAISPNGRMPALVDQKAGGFCVFESAAIMMYLADKHGKFFSSQEATRSTTIQWLFWQMAGLGPMAGQVSHFTNYAPKIDPKADHSYALERYQREYGRLLSVMDKRLGKEAFLAGEYSIADMACFPWVIPYKRFGVPDLDKAYPNLARWFQSIRDRPAVRRGVDVLKIGFSPNTATASDESVQTLFRKSKM